MDTLFILPYQRGVAPLLMMTTFAMEIRTNPTGYEDNTIANNNEYTFEINTNQILTEKDTNIPDDSAIHITAFGTTTSYGNKQHSSVSAISSCISVPSRSEALDASSGSTLRTGKDCVSMYGVSPYEDLTSAMLETEYGMLLDKDTNRNRERSFSLIPPTIVSPSAQENLFFPPTSNAFTNGYSKTDTLSTSLNAFQSTGPVFMPNKSVPIMRQPIAQLPKTDPLLDRNGAERAAKSGKKTKILDRSQSMHALDPVQWKCAVMNSWYSLKHGECCSYCLGTSTHSLL